MTLKNKTNFPERDVTTVNSPPEMVLYKHQSLIAALKNILFRVEKNQSAFYVTNFFVKLLEKDCLNENGLKEVKGYLEMMGETL